jgi:uncharacterized protein YbjT (DUF2867 family)
MTEKKLIAVLGATGSQGGGLARAVLDDPASPFALRAITRNATSEKAKQFADRGAEVVEADLANQQALTEALTGAHGAYVVTNFWESMSAAVELQQARIAAQAVKDAGVAHAIWSTLEDTRPALSHTGAPRLQGGYTVPHFDAKDEANRYFTDAGAPTTFLRTTYYWESFTTDFGPVRNDDGRLMLSLPLGDRRLSGIAAEDIGRTAYGIFQAGPELAGHTISIAGEHLTGGQYAEGFATVLGEPVDFRSPGFDEFRALAGDEIGNMFQYYYEAERQFVGDRDLDRVRRFNPRLAPFRQWLEAHKSAFTD